MIGQWRLARGAPGARIISMGDMDVDDGLTHHAHDMTVLRCLARRPAASAFQTAASAASVCDPSRCDVM